MELVKKLLIGLLKFFVLYVLLFVIFVGAHELGLFDLLWPV